MPVDEATILGTSPQPTFKGSLFYPLTKVTIYIKPIKRSIKCDKVQVCCRRVTRRNKMRTERHLGDTHNITMDFSVAKELHVEPRNVAFSQNCASAALMRSFPDPHVYLRIEMNSLP